MAIRLNVLILKPSGAVESRFEDAVGRLLGRPGIDVVMLERLPSQETDSTEGLALQSLSGTFACLAWEDPELVLSRLENAGKPSVRRAHQRDPNPPTAVHGTEKIDSVFFYDMRDDQLAGSVLDDLRVLLETLRVPTFSLNLGASASKMGDAASVKSQANDKPPGITVSQDAPASQDASASQENSDEAKPPSRVRASERKTSRSETSNSLDQLVDELDEMDL